MKNEIQQYLTRRFFRPVIIVETILCTMLLVVSVSAKDADKLLKFSGIKGGLVVHLGCSNGAMTARLRAGDQYIVHGLDKDSTEIAAARDRMLKQGIYGPVSIDRWDGQCLPYADNLVNLVIVEERENMSEAELLRILAPNGVALIHKQGQWEKIIKP